MSQHPRELSREEVSLCAHDLRGVLTVIAGYAALLRRSDLDERGRGIALDGIEAAVGRADALVGDTLSGRVGARSQERFDLSLLVEQAAEDARVATDREVLVDTQGPVIVEADPVALSRVLENLLSNAAKYAPAGAIEVSLTHPDGMAVLDVSDRGPGIPEAEREAVFDPFMRLERDQDAPGSGLGLVVVRSVMERSGGDAFALEREGGGTVMRIRIPLSDT
jgi:two-component system sensor histidine kinase MprB